MPLIYSEKYPDSASAAVWEITESAEELLKELNPSIIIPGFRNENRKKEWLAARNLIKLLSGKLYEVCYDSFGKPYLNNSSAHISLSHTKQYVASILDNDFPCGIDLEIITPRIEKVAHRFLCENEKAFLQSESTLEMLYVIWGAKECAYKIYGKGGIEFSTMIEVFQFRYSDSGQTEVLLRTESKAYKYSVFWKQLGNLMLIRSTSEKHVEL